MSVTELKNILLRELEKLPFHHRDPFDRMLIAQAQYEKLTIISRDRSFRLYEANVIWE
ncbi:MAG: PIN domain-containing protein [Bacteroidota bacterium]